VTCFGVKLHSRRMEYSGVVIQGLAWWIWSLNFQFLEGRHGLDWALHFFCPAVLLASLTVAAHYARKEFFERRPASPDESRITRLSIGDGSENSTSGSATIDGR
jgi:hypothetical protein